MALDGDVSLDKKYIALIGPVAFQLGCNECLAKANPSKLSDAERLAVWIYTSTDDDWYSRINGELRERRLSAEVKFLSTMLNGALIKLPRCGLQVYRGISIPSSSLDDYLDDYQLDDHILLRAFVSTTLAIGQAFGGNVFMTVQSKNGRILGDYAGKPSEREVLFKSGSSFRLQYMERRGNRVALDLLEL